MRDCETDRSIGADCHNVQVGSMAHYIVVLTKHIGFDATFQGLILFGNVILVGQCDSRRQHAILEDCTWLRFSKTARDCRWARDLLLPWMHVARDHASRIVVKASDYGVVIFCLLECDVTIYCYCDLACMQYCDKDRPWMRKHVIMLLELSWTQCNRIV